MTHLLVAYDIVDDKRRTRVFKTLARFGQHVQFSLFECFLDDKELLTMQHKVEEHVDTDEDSLLYVYLCATCHGRLKHVGVRKAPPVDSDLLIV